MALTYPQSLYISPGKVRLSLVFTHSNQLHSPSSSHLLHSLLLSAGQSFAPYYQLYSLQSLEEYHSASSVIMLFTTTLSLLSISAMAVAIPTHPPMTRLFPRQNSTANVASTGGDAAANGAAVDRAGGTLNAEAAAEANQRDDTATRAFSGVSVKAPDGSCLFIDPLSGDFRQNLIPVQTKTCDGSANEKFDIITKGKHIDQDGGMLIVSSEVRRFAKLLALPNMLILE